MQLRTFIRYFLIITLSIFPLISKAEEVLETKYGIIVTTIGAILFIICGFTLYRFLGIIPY